MVSKVCECVPYRNLEKSLVGQPIGFPNGVNVSYLTSRCQARLGVAPRRQFRRARRRRAAVARAASARRAERAGRAARAAPAAAVARARHPPLPPPRTAARGAARCRGSAGSWSLRLHCDRDIFYTHASLFHYSLMTFVKMSKWTRILRGLLRLVGQTSIFYNGSWFISI